MRRVLFYITPLVIVLFFATSACDTTGSSVTTTGDSNVTITFSSNGRPVAKDEERFLPEDIRSIYLFSIINNTAYEDVEDLLLEELEMLFPEKYKLRISTHPGKADAVLTAEIRKYAEITATTTYGEPDRMKAYLLLEIRVKDAIRDKEILTNDVIHFAYYNKITPPVTSAVDIQDEFVTNLACFIGEIVYYGTQRTRYEYGATNKFPYADSDSGNPFAPPKLITNESATNENGTFDVNDLNLPY